MTLLAWPVVWALANAPALVSGTAAVLVLTLAGLSPLPALVAALATVAAVAALVLVRLPGRSRPLAYVAYEAADRVADRFEMDWEERS